jgi:ribosomal-protein-alanine N-acetyltransferase
VVTIRPLALDDAAALLDLRSRHRAFLEPWEPLRDDAFYTLERQRQGVEASVRERDEGRGAPFVIVHERAVVGAVNLSAIVRGVFQNAYLGYWISPEVGGRGFATEAVRQAVAAAFRTLALHRVQAAVIPRNTASVRVLEKVGFREEGLALRYLRIAGVWEDHRLFALTAEDWR